MTTLQFLTTSLFYLLAFVRADFQVHCGKLTAQRSDPIVQPGGPSDHVHYVVGGPNFSRTGTGQYAIGASSTTCDKPLDKSNYWIPAVYHHNNNGTYSLLPFLDTALYYQNRACNYTTDTTRHQCDPSQYAIAPPAGLHMLAGNPALRTYDDSSSQRAMSHMCIQGQSFGSNALPQRSCDILRLQVYFPSCWNGKDRDSPDHSSHMAYPTIGDYNIGICPASHPVAIYSIFFEFMWDTKSFLQTTTFYEWIYAMIDTTGYGLHGDFLNGWTDQNRLENAMRTCSGPNGVNDQRCTLRVNGQLGQGTNSLFNKTDTPVPPEEVGVNGRSCSCLDRRQAEGDSYRG